MCFQSKKKFNFNSTKSKNVSNLKHLISCKSLQIDGLIEINLEKTF